MVFEASGVDEAAGGVVREVAEAQGDAAQVLEASVDGLAWGRWRCGGGRSRSGVSVALSVRVLASVWISSRPSGTACFRESMSCCVRCFPRPGSSVR